MKYTNQLHFGTISLVSAKSIENVEVYKAQPVSSVSPNLRHCFLHCFEFHNPRINIRVERIFVLNHHSTDVLNRYLELDDKDFDILHNVYYSKYVFRIHLSYYHTKFELKSVQVRSSHFCFKFD